MIEKSGIVSLVDLGTMHNAASFIIYVNNRRGEEKLN